LELLLQRLQLSDTPPRFGKQSYQQQRRRHHYQINRNSNTNLLQSYLHGSNDERVAARLLASQVIVHDVHQHAHVEECEGADAAFQATEATLLWPHENRQPEVRVLELFFRLFFEESDQLGLLDGR